jgi:hypothetical protein
MTDERMWNVFGGGCISPRELAMSAAVDRFSELVAARR